MTKVFAIRPWPSAFERVHALPQTGGDVPGDLDARLVVLGVDQRIHGKAIVRGNRQQKLSLSLAGTPLDCAEIPWYSWP